MSDKYNLQTLSGSISIGKGDRGETGERGPIGPKGDIGDNNVCVGTSPTDEAEIWFDTSSDEGGEAVATLKELQKVDQRVSEIISSNGGGVKDNEIIDAREGEICLGDKIRKISSSLDTKANKIEVDNDINGLDVKIAENKSLTDSEISRLKEIANTWETFKNNGGEVGGCLSFKKKVRQIEQEINMRDRTYLQRQNLSNYNGYPTWATVIEDPNDDTNTNGMIFMLGNGVEGDSYRDNYFRPLKMGYGQRNYIGSQNVPWDDIYLRGNSKNTNGYTRLPNGLIMQWATLNIKAQTETSIQLPLTFPNAILGMYATPRGNRANGVWSIPWWDVGIVKVWNGSTIEINYYVLAIGY